MFCGRVLVQDTHSKTRNLGTIPCKRRGGGFETAPLGRVRGGRLDGAAEGKLVLK